MKPTEQLRQEHEAIELVLAVLEKLAAKLSTGAMVDAVDMDGVLEFIAVFADQCHHGKEEGFLFPALIAAGLPSGGGPIAVMLSEHEQGRYCVRQMIDGWRRCRAGDKAAAPQLAEDLSAYVELLTAHIQKENTVLFPIAERILSGETEGKIFNEFERFEVEKIGAGKHEQFHQMLGRLRQTYLTEAELTRVREALTAAAVSSSPYPGSRSMVLGVRYPTTGAISSGLFSKLERGFVVGFDRSRIACFHGDADESGIAGRPKGTPSPHRTWVQASAASFAHHFRAIHHQVEGDRTAL